MNKSIYPLLVVFVGIVLSGATYVLSLWCDKTPQPFYFVFIASYIIAGTVTGNMHQPNEYLGWATMAFVWTSICSILFLPFRAKICNYVEKARFRGLGRALFSVLLGVAFSQLFLLYGYSSYGELPEPFRSLWSILGAGNFDPDAKYGPAALGSLLILSALSSVVVYGLLAVKRALSKRVVSK